ncbi:MAG: hypothetical protein QOJ64_854 [Acidobacteriota bacterium]|nr:hypothetical protein [Acidobacteriota bacterium]
MVWRAVRGGQSYGFSDYWAALAADDLLWVNTTYIKRQTSISSKPT